MNIENIKRIKIDNHLVDMFKLDDLVVVCYYQYNDNKSCLTMYYNLKDSKFNFNYNITDRQKTLLEDYINKNYR